MDVQYNNDSGFPFIDKQGRTQVPLRATMEAFGATVEWDQASLTATVEKNSISVKVPIGKSFIYIDGVEVANNQHSIKVECWFFKSVFEEWLEETELFEI